MTPERWRQVEELYEAALKHEAGQRKDFVFEASAGDDALRQKVEELLLAHELAGDFLAVPVLEAVARMVAVPPGSLVGQRISHYEILSLVGSGGMGDVYKARDARLDRTVALKMLPAGLASEEDRMRRFIREAKAASAFNHPNVAGIYDIGEGLGTRFIAMEYVEGQTLAAKIGGRPLDSLEIVEIGIQVADALSEAHAKGITHRDIKSANLMVTPRGHVKVLDFGLAKITPANDQNANTMAEPTQIGMVMGTPHYMSPEQVLGHAVDHRTDIFSLGVVFYEMATGRLPFAGATAGETMDRILHAEPDMIAPLDEGDLGRIVRKCLEKDPDQRYASARELWTDLQSRHRDTFPAEGIVDRTGKRQRSPKRLLAVKRGWAVVTAAIILVAALTFALRSRKITPVLPFVARDWILVTDVDNQTGDPVFDKSLLTAFVIGLEQSRYVNVLPRATAAESLKRMKKTGAEPIDEILGRDIALREGVRALIIPSITGVGGTYRLAARVQDPATARDVRTEQVSAGGKDKILGAVDELMAKIRLDLGESLSTPAETRKPLAQVTTASMDALKQYSLGNEKESAANFAEAKTYLENSLRIDPGFIAAKGQLGILLFEHFNREEGRQLLAEAMPHVDSLTDREKYGIPAFYAVAVENDLPKAIQLYKLLLGLHPDSWTIYNNLGWYSFQLGRAEDSVAAYKEAVRLNPYATVSYNGLILVYLYQLSDVDAALDLCRKEISYDSGLLFPHESMGWAYLGQGRLDEARQAFEKALEINGKAAEVRSRLGNTYLLQGRYRDAAEMYLSVPPLDSAEYNSYYDAGLACQFAGDRQCERQNFAKFIAEVNQRIKESPNQAEYRLALAKAFTRTARAAEGQVAGITAIQMEPAKHFEIAELLSVQGKADEAVGQLELAVQSGFRNFIQLKVDPDLQSLQNVPRFRELLKTHLNF